MAKLYNISNWNEQSWWNTGGTRDKKIYLNPEDSELYYFKQSFKKGQRDFKHEFWSEIIASEIGKELGFDVLSYHIAIRGTVVGCISKSMINQSTEELVEGGKYLHAYDNTFNPEDVKQRNQYTFDLIIEALTSFKRDKHIKDLIRTIVFDALIGNSDRHQENWAIINDHTIISEGVRQIESDLESGEIELFPSWVSKIVKFVYTKKGKIRPEIQMAKLRLPIKTRFAPIYDSGCSFGRELEDERVTKMLNDENEIQKYVKKGLSEIHWGTGKLSHFDLINKLIGIPSHNSFVLEALSLIMENFIEAKVRKIVFSIDKELVDNNNPNSLPIERKELIVKLLTLRYNLLKEIYSRNK